ncbi:C-GCAxxG-C-C family protein [bacterium]|nr:C-GCAxxG-C-C family protein [bacterium]
MKNPNKIVDIKLPQNGGWIDQIKKEAYSNMKKYGNCTQAMLVPFLKIFDIDNPQLVASAGSMQGGMLASQTCGVYSAGMMVLGLLIGRKNIEQGHEAMYPIIGPAQKLNKKFRDYLGSYSCQELTGVDFTDLNAAMVFGMSEDHKKCIQRVSDGAGIIAELLVELKEKGELFRIES